MNHSHWIRAAILLAAFLISAGPLSARKKSDYIETEDSRPKNTYTPKTGLSLSVNTTLADLGSLPYHPLAPVLNANEGFNFGIFRNSRLFPGMYIQPEIAYMVYNGEGNQRYTFISVMPVQLQLGVHLGWIRPYISGGAFANMEFSARDAEGKVISPRALSDRLSWGCSYGAGIDLLSRMSLQYRRRIWMNDFKSLQPGRLNETCLIASFFF